MAQIRPVSSTASESRIHPSVERLAAGFLLHNLSDGSRPPDGHQPKPKNVQNSQGDRCNQKAANKRPKANGLVVLETAVLASPNKSRKREVGGAYVHKSAWTTKCLPCLGMPFAQSCDKKIPHEHAAQYAHEESVNQGKPHCKYPMHRGHVCGRVCNSDHKRTVA